MARIKINQSGAIKVVSRSTREGLRDHMTQVLEIAKADAPLDTGELRESGQLFENPKSVRISFNAPHAAIQHERLDYNHPRGGKAKYLEDAYNDNMPGAIRRIAMAIKKGLSRG